MSNIKKYRKKPVVIEAVQFVDHLSANLITEWAISTGVVIYRSFFHSEAVLLIPTLEGTMMVSLGDWVIRGVNGEFYPCKPDIFEATYEGFEG